MQQRLAETLPKDERGDIKIPWLFLPLVPQAPSSSSCGSNVACSWLTQEPKKCSLQSQIPPKYKVEQRKGARGMNLETKWQKSALGLIGPEFKVNFQARDIIWG